MRVLLDISIACLFVDAIYLNGNYNTDDTAVICWLFVYVVRILFFMFFHGEFDPGSGRTLAACLTHASRTMTVVLALPD